ncbi:MAG TPA: hypothetical protein VMI52_01640 [Acetobacteraceae bacterium]|nr:hypothetical protein [Acetobacteraceae bacterium]
MPLPTASAPRNLIGIAFSIEELILVRNWAERKGMRMAVELDHVCAEAEYEEVLITYPPEQRQRWIMFWRGRGGIFMQQPAQETLYFASITEALRVCGPEMTPAPPLARQKPWRRFFLRRGN